MSNYPYTTGVRLLIIPIAIAVGVVLFMVFSKRLRKPLIDEEAVIKETKKVKKFELKEKINELIDGDDMDFVPMN